MRRGSLLLSVLIPSYSHREGLVAILRTLCKSSELVRSEIEVIVADDSQERLLSFAEVRALEGLFNRFVYRWNRPPQGAVKNWNSLLDEAKGRYSWLNHHDECIVSSSQLEILIDALQRSEPEIVVLGMKKRLRNSRVSGVHREERHTGCLWLIRVFMRYPDLFMWVNPLGAPSCLVVSRSVGLRYMENLRWLVDVSFYRNLFSSVANDQVLLLVNDIWLMSDLSLECRISKDLKKDKRRIESSEREVIFSMKGCHMTRQKRIILVLFVKGAFMLMRLMFKVRCKKERLG